MTGEDRFISAGAGTGKTHTISTTYVDIFDRAIKSNEALDVGNVVAITFTRKAAAEMKSRIVGMIDEKGDDPKWLAIRSSMTLAWISTVDSFARRILTEVGIFAGVDPDLHIGSASKVQSMLDRVVVRALSDNGDLIETLLGLYSIDVIKVAVDKAVLEKRYNMISSRPAEEVEAGLPLHDDPLLAKEISLASVAFKRLFELVYESFLAEMKQERLTDFAGVVVTLRDILTSESWVRERYAKQFKYIIVDEFQDTNALQKEIIDLLRTKDNHVIYVGDAKQSIYRFRGAEVEVFSRAMDDVLARLGTIDHLETNYRSHPDIIRFCNAFFPKIFDGQDRQYSQSYEAVEPLAVVEKTAWRPRVKVLFDPEDEAEAVARYVASIEGKEFEFLKRKSDSDKVWLETVTRPIKFGDIAVLLRKMRPAKGKEYMRALERYNVPYYTLGESGFFDMPEIAGIMATLRVLSNPRDDLAMTTVLMSPVLGLDVNEMARMKHRARTSEGKDGSICRAFDVMDGTEVSQAKVARLRRFVEVVKRYSSIKNMIRPSELVERVVDELDYQAYLASEDPTGRKSANLRKFMVTAKKLDEAGVSLRELVRMLNSYGMDDEEQASIESEETNAVKIMTVHKAKGLEFPITIVADSSWRDTGSDVPILFNRDEDSISFTLNCEAGEECLIGRLKKEEMSRDFEEEKRSLYVAATRASDMLVMTLSNSGRGRRPWREMMIDSMIQVDEDVASICPDFEGVAEMLTAPAVDPLVLGSGKKMELDGRYTGPVQSEDFKEYLSYSDIVSTHGKADRTGHGNGDEVEDGGFRGPQPGILAHKIMECVGVNSSLRDLGSGESPWVPPGMVVGIKEATDVWRYLKRLEGHDLVREIEGALEVRNEYEMTRPFGRYILYGRPDKLVRTSGGWKVVDFKFARSTSHKEDYEFQMKFYLYLARELFRPILGAEIFYLKDGVTRVIKLGDEDVRDLENGLVGWIEGRQDAH